MIFIDETGAKTNMTRLYGRARNGQRCHDHAPDGRWERTSILSAIRVTGETCSVVFDGALDGKIYNAYIEQFLLPTLKAGDMVIMDNLNVHKSKTAQKLITEKGCEYIFLPEYSPDLLIIYFIFKHILLAQNRPESDADGSEVTESLSVIPSQVLSNWKIPDSSSLPFSDNSKLLHPDSNQENTREYVPAKHDHLLLQAKTF